MEKIHAILPGPKNQKKKMELMIEEDELTHKQNQNIQP